MGTIQAGSATATATANLSATSIYSGPVVGSTYVLASESPATVKVSTKPGRVTQTPLPVPHVFLAHSNVVRSFLWAPNAVISKKGRGMDKIPVTTVTQFQRVTMGGYVVTKTGAAVTQATVQSVRANVFRPSVEGGEPLKTFMPTVASSIYDTEQTALDPDGYNVEVEFEMGSETVASGGSAYQLAVVVELLTGEQITLRGRVLVEPVLSLPINSY